MTTANEPFDAGYSKARANFLSETARIVSNVWRHPANRDGRGRALARFASWQMHKRFRRRARTIEFHGHRLICYPDSHSISAAVYFNGLPDYAEMRFMQRYLRQGDGFLDLGANVGVYTLLARSLAGPAGFVDAFEPMAETADRLAEQIRVNGFHNVAIHRLVACDQNGTVNFGFADSDSLMHLQRRDETAGTGACQLQGIRLDDWIGDRRFSMAKMDIEGAEPVALAGATKMLGEANPPVWLTEIAGYSKLYGIPTHEFIADIRERGYEPAFYDPLDNALTFSRRPWELPVKNIFLVATSRTEEVIERLNTAVESEDTCE